jgi:hypothetical protein
MAQDAPHWAPNAVATDKGWTDPKTGELLVAVVGLLEETPKKRTKKTTTVEEVDTPVVE